MGNRHALRLRVLLVSAIVLAVVAASFPALAAEPLAVEPPAGESVRSVVTRGTCRDGPSHWRLSILTEPGGVLVTRLLVKGGRAGQRWNIFMDDNGRGIFAGSRISHEQGLFAVKRRIRNGPGVDHIHFAAHNVVTGDQCRGRAAL